LIAATTPELITEFIAEISDTYELTINNPLDSYLNRVMSREFQAKTIFIHQTGSIDKLQSLYPEQINLSPSTPMLPIRDNIDKTPVFYLLLINIYTCKKLVLSII